MKINSIKIKIEIELGTIYNLHACNTRRRRKPKNKKAEDSTPRRKTDENKPKTQQPTQKAKKKHVNNSNPKQIFKNQPKMRCNMHAKLGRN